MENTSRECNRLRHRAHTVHSFLYKFDILSYALWLFESLFTYILKNDDKYFAGKLK